MAITDPLVLPADVIMVPVEELPEETRALFEYREGDYALTRPRSRTPSKVIDADTVTLLKQFQSPKTIVQAVIGYSREANADPQETLEGAYPLISNLVQAALLVDASSSEAERISQSLEVGDRVAGYRVSTCIQLVEDSELYQVKRPGESHAALKILRATAHPSATRMLAREGDILGRLDGSVSPALHEMGTHEGRPYLVMDWCAGIDVESAAAELRAAGDAAGQQALLALCTRVLDAYSYLHVQRVIHGDVHPRNVLVDAEGCVQIVDYGLARLDGPDPQLNHAERGGVGFFFEPEYVQAVLTRSRPPRVNELGEQYALAALVYYLLTGSHYLDFSLERDVMLRQILDERPVPFAHWDAAFCPEVERVVGQALSKAPEDRFPSVAEFARAFGEAALRDGAASAAFESGAPAHATHAAQAPREARAARAADALLRNVLADLSPDGALFASGLPKAPKCSIMAGAAGIAYALYRIACARQSARLLSWADLWAVKALRESEDDDAFASEEFEVTPETVGRVSPYHTISGVHAVHALLGHAMGDLYMQQASIEAFVQSSQAPCEELDLTLGRASTLLAASLLLDTVTGSEVLKDDSLRELGDGIAAEIWERLDAQPSIEEARERSNLGIAHGWAGLIYATMRWCRSSGADLPAALTARMAQLAELAEPTGRGARWKWMLERPSPGSAYPYMPGWCNGSAGYVHLWTLAHRMLHDETYLRLARWAAWNAWEDPQAAGSLCCGLAGRAYALLNLFKHTGESVWLDRARVLAERAAQAEPTPDIPFYSLYKGTVGVAVLAADLENPSGAAMPFFEEEGWSA